MAARVQERLEPLRRKDSPNCPGSEFGVPPNHSITLIPGAASPWLMRPAGLLLLLLLAPAAEACSLAYEPFGQTAWDAEGRLRFVDFDRLQRVEDGRERTVAQGYFLMHAEGDGGLLVAGQDGLGSDCSGEPWLRWGPGGAVGAVAWERSGFGRPPQVFPHEDGPLVAFDGKLWRWADGGLHGTDWSFPATYLLGVTADGRPVHQDGETVVAGAHAVQVPLYTSVAVAHNATATAVVFAQEDEARLLLVSAGGVVSETRWPTGPDRSQPSVAWTGAEWVVAAGQRAYLVAGGSVTDLGVKAVAVGSRGPQPVAFQESGYTVFAGTRAVERWTREDGVWTLAAPEPTSTASPVSASTSQTAAGEAPDADGGGFFGRDAPAPPLAWALAALGGLAARRRRRAPFEP